MFEHEIFAARKFTAKKDREDSYKAFLSHIRLPEEVYPFVEFVRPFERNTPVRFKVQSWGGYLSASGTWRVFISYQSPDGKEIKFWNWAWDAAKNRPVDGKCDWFHR